MRENDNCPAGWRCPECGHTESFTVSATCTVTLTDDGTDDEREFDWDKGSHAMCNGCYHRAMVGTFTATDGPCPDCESREACCNTCGGGERPGDSPSGQATGDAFGALLTNPGPGGVK